MKDSQQRDCNKLIVSSCTSHLILIQKFDISVLDIHKEWNDQIESDHTDNVATNVKSVKWSDKLGGSLTDIRTYPLSQRRYVKREYVPLPFGNNKNMIKVGPETLFLNSLFSCMIFFLLWARSVLVSA